MRKLFKTIFTVSAFIITVFLSLIGALAVGRALIGLTIFGSVVTGFSDPTAIFLLNLGNVAITIYVFFRLYRFFEYMIGKFFLVICNLLIYIKVTTRYLKDLREKNKGDAGK